MKIGKLNWDELQHIIDSSKSVRRPEVLVSNGVGEDCSIIDFGQYHCAVSTDPITGAAKNIGSLAVNINCNDIASSGAEPVGILVTILAPESTTIEEIRQVMVDIDSEAKKLNVEVIGGHTEVTDAVNRLIVSCTVLGKALAGTAVATSGAKVGDDIVVTKKLCIEGTTILANEYGDRLKSVLTEAELEEAKCYSQELSVATEGKIAGGFGVSSMHDITEGGVLGALWEMAAASKTGFEVAEEAMPISDITLKLCKHFEIDPLRLISSGSMLIAVSDGKGLVKKLEEASISANIIGKITKDGGVLVSAGVLKTVEPPENDELFNIKIEG